MGCFSSRPIDPEGKGPNSTPPPEPENNKDVQAPIATPTLNPDGTPTAFTLQELRIATDNFSDDRIIGKGGFGYVYRGIVYFNGVKRTEVAVKKLNAESTQGQQEWLTEIVVLGRIQHKNIVRLYGYCAEEGEGILVYEFLPEGSLDYHLFPREFGLGLTSKLTLEQRLNIVSGITLGLAALHERNIIHRDFKTSNVLLDQEYNPKITDFGLSRMLAPEASHASTRIMGTLGYMDPNFYETGQLTRMSDVYSFGVMLFELVTGRRAREEDISIAEWVNSFPLDAQMDMVFDPTIHEEILSKSMKEVAKRLVRTACYCTQSESSLRPSMDELVSSIRGISRRMEKKRDV